MKCGDIICFAISRSVDGEWLKPDGNVYPFLWVGKELNERGSRPRLIIGGLSLSILKTKTKMGKTE